MICGAWLSMTPPPDTYYISPGEGFHEVFSRMNLAVDEVIRFDRTYEHCTVQSCVGPCDRSEYRPFGQSEELFRKNALYLEEARKAGVILTGTCAPYLTGWLPVRGAVLTKSH